ncbi:MAG: hypothetical protein KF794_04075 [Xanthobacteraceae bacterium]|nr:hypothetical protein [Xanthobacteraceae bacterium]QYK45880.1 MAG: hypothetical protein KF794_04075 [Xanthobacteraceae bacterium]
MNFWKTRNGTLTIVALLVAIGVAGAWRIQSKADQRNARETQFRIERDVKNSIDNATKNIKLCPLSQPDCNR